MELSRKITNVDYDQKIKLLKAKVGKKGYWTRSVYNLFVYVLLFDLGFVFLFPFLHMIVTSLKSPDDLIDTTVRWIPKMLFWRNYVTAADALNYFTYFKNSVLVTVLCIVGHILACSFIAYGFARFNFKGRDLLFMFVIITLLVPPQVIIMPLYIQYSKFRWMNTYLPLIMPTFFGFGLRGGLFIFIFRQFFLGLPKELENAALIDGCGFMRTYWRIILPISKSAILVSSVLSMIWHWNDSFEPVIYLSSPKKWLLPIVLPQMYETLKSMQIGDLMLEPIFFNEGVVMAGTFLVLFPLLVVYLILQHQFVEGIERTGLVE